MTTYVFETTADQARVIALGREAWQRKRDGSDWADWVHIGQALDAGRTLAMRAANTQNPQGRQYAEAFAYWLSQNDYDGMDKKLRADLLGCIKDLVQIERWRTTLAENLRLAWNHPTTVLRHWRSSLKISAAPQPNKVVKGAGMEIAFQTLTIENQRLEQENQRLEHELAKARRGTLFDSGDSVIEIATAIDGEIRSIRTPAGKYREIADALQGKAVAYARQQRKRTPGEDAAAERKAIKERTQ
jgi:hypothetical protein